MIDDTKKDENEVVDADASTDTVTDAQAPASLTINDLTNLKQIIDVAAARGAFKTNEFQVIGVTTDRLTAFLQSVTPQEPVEDTEEASKTEEA